MELFKSRTRVAYTNAVGDKVYPVVVDIKKGIKSTEEIQFVSSDVNTGILSVAFISGNENFNVSGADVVCSVMRPDASTLELPCEVVRENIVEVPLGINGTSQDGVYSFDFKVLKGGNKIVGTPIMNYSVSLSIGNDMVIEEDDRLPILTMLITQVNELKEETREIVNQANVATEASREATANAIEATNNANAVSERVSQETATAISEIQRDTENAIASMSQTTSNAIADMTQKTDEAVTMVNNNLANINNVVTTKVAELDNAKSDMTTTVSNKVNEVETRFNALTSKQQQDAEVIDARDGEVSLKARLDRDIEKAKQVYVNVEGSHISTDSSSGYAKDVEILGNTIQDASNLADIRSVGDTVEGQELYEIPVLSCGKNLFIDAIYKIEDTNGWSPKIKIDKTKSYVCKFGKATKTPYIRLFNENLTIIPVDESFPIKGKIIENASYFSIQYVNSLTNIQLEEGTVATPYEPYQEDKLTILSPVQLERVGGVADRIIEKDGVWGVEKNVVTKIFNGSEEWINDLQGSSGENSYGAKVQCLDMPRYSGFNYNDIICDSLPVKRTYEMDIEGCSIGWGNYFFIKVLTSTIGDRNLNSFKKWVENNNILIKHQTTQPTFIPLPHDQQVKLRTFANKTNISFLTEIEGTIKAQVPKSLGATVNTHTEQINSLNKELDRVKKLEESTVSTVTTESDFTTVEATSNGYFEDVKLEGKTLVNLWGNKSSDFSLSGQMTFNEDTQFAEVTTTENIFSNIFTRNVSLLKPNTLYTIIVDIIENTAPSDVSILRVSSTNTNKNETAFSNFVAFIFGGKVGRFTYLARTIEDLSNATIGLRTYVDNSARVVGAKIKFRITILEGDHTQNPPSYFEGLKSVGQSASEDGADEIVVSSVKGDGNLLDENVEFKVGHINTSGGISSAYKHTAYTDYILLEKGDYCINTLDGFKPTIITIYNSQKVFKTQVNTTTFTLTESSYIRLSFRTLNDTEISVASIKNLMLNRGTIPKPYTPHQADKKRLLYYNNETQAWEKPILREWDSIEKHADGKYYYHQRSGEVVLNGSEHIGEITNPLESNYARFYLVNTSPLGLRVTLPISNLFKSGNTGGTTEEYVGIDGNGKIVISILKSKLSTQDVQGFKQWLQANNVTVVYQLAEEKVYECTNIDLITYANETNYVVESGAIVPKSILKVHNNISNVVKILQEKVSLLENKFIEGLKKVLAGDMYSLAEILYPEDFVEENPENNIMLLPFE